MADRPTLTTSAGAPIGDNQNSLSVGERGPLLIQDYQLFEKLAHQNRERIPERVVHAKGWGAFGTFTVTSTEVTKYTNAKLFSEVGKQTDLLLRFSTVAGEQGAADAERDVRGFSVKFYTEEGNWDVVGNNTPVFFVRDPYKFPDFIRTQKRHPRTNMRSPTAMWDFWSLSPESLHQITILFSDRGLPVGPQYVNGYGSHTFSFWNDAGERVWCKFHFKTQQGHKFYTNEEAETLIGKNRESYQEELYGTIERGEFPKWTLFVQIMTQEQADNEVVNPFDLTKVWPHARYPLIEVGELELNRNPDNYFAEIEQAAFSPSNIVRGISFSPDKMLRRGSSPMPMRIATGWARIMRRCPSTVPSRPSTPITRTACCASSRAMACPTLIMNRTASAGRSRTSAIWNRRWSCRASPSATIIARPTRIMRSRARSGPCSTMNRRVGSTAIWRRRCMASPTSSSNASFTISNRSTRPMRRASAMRWPAWTKRMRR